jgi:thiamine-phosphate pyrophosphorylase
MSGATARALRRPLPAGPYLVLDVDVCTAAGRPATHVAAAAVKAGVAVVQIRAKRAGVRAFVDLTVAVAHAVQSAGQSTRHAAVQPVVLVDDRVDVALAARARGAAVDGVHLGQHDLAAADARALLGPDALVGISAARDAHVRAVPTDLVDYLGAGPVRLTPTKPEADTAIGFDGLAAVVAASALPVVAIGGLGALDAATVRASGAHGLAVVSAVCSAADVSAAAARLVRAWSSASAEDAVREDLVREDLVRQRVAGGAA